ncbi:MAG: serine/threonine-protein kinase [Myxococcales bacterium]|nr:serine/threonine protein kinase [Polyangiaceae bacterium]MDW8251536.1 serine/threonine-protein kinase [Myxococcales bacterium]
MGGHLALAEARVGQTLRGKWTLQRLLGVGGMAAVYAAVHRNGRRGAVKILHPHIAADPVLRARFLQEARVVNTIDHPGIVAVLDDDEEEGSPFLVMELLEGRSLEEAFRGVKQLPWEEVLRIAEGLLEALAAAHEAGVVHRDLKPDNVFLCQDGRVKILDFGIARVEEGVSMTQTGTTLGTPTYMAPEQAIGQKDQIGPATDVWAVGATMFTLLTGRYVHEGSTLNQVLVMAATRPAPPIGSLVVLPDSIAALVDRSLAFDPSERFPNARAMLEALRLARKNLGPIRLKIHDMDPSARTVAGVPALSGEPTLAAPSGPAPSASSSAIPIHSLHELSPQSSPVDTSPQLSVSSRSRLGWILAVLLLAVPWAGLWIPRSGTVPLVISSASTPAITSEVLSGSTVARPAEAERVPGPAIASEAPSGSTGRVLDLPMIAPSAPAASSAVPVLSSSPSWRKPRLPARIHLPEAKDDTYDRRK